MRDYFLPYAMAVLFLSSCDVINEKEGYTEPFQPATAVSGRSILLEEYTGMRCVNCPEAADEAHLLKQTFGESLIVVSIHAGSFAVPSGSFQPDLRTEAGNSYFSHFGFAGTPVGMVDRKKQGGAVALSPAGWADAIRKELIEPTKIKMEGDAVYEGNDSCRVSVKIFGITPTDRDMRLMLWLVEDSIRTPQVVPGGVNSNYLQRHVLREVLNGTWGESVVSNENHAWSMTRCFKLRPEINREQCSIVVLLTMPASNEIASALELKINLPEESIKKMETLVSSYPQKPHTFASVKFSK